MPSRTAAVLLLSAGLAGGCSSPLDVSKYPESRAPDRLNPADPPPSAFREPEADAAPARPELGEQPTPGEFVRFALYNSPRVEAAYQRFVAAGEQVPQVGALPDPRLGVGFYLDEVETRVGPQKAKVGVSQTFPWAGTLSSKEDAASRAAMAAWRRFEAERLVVTEQVVRTLYELAYLDAAIGIAAENLALLGSFEEVVRARYRVGTEGHPELIRVQVELGQVEDRLAELRAMRPAYVAELNAALNRDGDEPVGPIGRLPGLVVSEGAGALAETARTTNPLLLALDEQAQEQRALGRVAEKAGLPDLTFGIDYIVTGDAVDSTIPESGDDPIQLSFGMNVPLWRDKYRAGVRETVAKRLAVAHERAGEANRIDAAVHRAWFEHTDADRRVRLYENTLIPKAEESLRASLAGFRAGGTSFLDLLDTERTLLEFTISAERARADRGEALARLNTLVGADVPTEPSDGEDPS